MHGDTCKNDLTWSKSSDAGRNLLSVQGDCLALMCEMQGDTD